MFTDGVVASVKICRGGDDSDPAFPVYGPTRGPDATFRGGVGDGFGPGSDRDTDGGVVVSAGPAPQEGSRT
ncbi:hypothetical protein SAMN04488066_101262 [Halorubrum aquaticum]|uniref:Uncharacterized protein n=1 Tax=Halorubrum aquaticum TaxID=387340 RepID=A0A1I2Z5P4_9EURY|nr:hypothetical protein SAMN04488066_101262 [Halorubrum aquaticum]